MRYRFVRLVPIIGCVLVHHLHAQVPARPAVVGTWRGTSLCQIRPSACRDEIVVYRITPTTARDSLALDARKVVNGAEEEMGVLGCRFNAPNGHLTCSIPSGTWHFTVRGDSLVGELRLSDGTRFRDVRTLRQVIPDSVVGQFPLAPARQGGHRVNRNYSVRSPVAVGIADVQANSHRAAGDLRHERPAIACGGSLATTSTDWWRSDGTLGIERTHDGARGLPRRLQEAGS